MLDFFIFTLQDKLYGRISTLHELQKNTVYCSKNNILLHPSKYKNWYDNAFQKMVEMSKTNFISSSALHKHKLSV